MDKEEEREKKEKKKTTEKEVIATQVIHIWSPVQVLTPPNRA